MASFYLDHDVSARVAHLLAEAGHDVLTTRAMGHERAGDHEQLLFAARNGRVLVSHNWRDYRLLHAAWRLWSLTWERSAQHGGILILQQGGPVMLAERVDALVGEVVPLSNRLFRLHADGWHDQS